MCVIFSQKHADSVYFYEKMSGLIALHIHDLLSSVRAEKRSAIFKKVVYRYMLILLYKLYVSNTVYTVHTSNLHQFELLTIVFLMREFCPGYKLAFW